MAGEGVRVALGHACQCHVSRPAMPAGAAPPLISSAACRRPPAWARPTPRAWSPARAHCASTCRQSRRAARLRLRSPKRSSPAVTRAGGGARRGEERMASAMSTTPSSVTTLRPFASPGRSGADRKPCGPYVVSHSEDAGGRTVVIRPPACNMPCLPSATRSLSWRLP